MKTAIRYLMLGSLFSAGCSGDVGAGDLTGGAMMGMNTAGTGDGQTGGIDPNTGMPIQPGAAGGSNVGAGGAATAGGGTTAGAGGPAVDGMPPSTGACVPGVAVSSQVPRITNLQYNNAVVDIFGVTSPNGSWSSAFEPWSNSELSATQWGTYKTTADAIAAAVMGTPLGDELAAAASDPTAFEDRVRSLGRRVFRRPLTNEEVASFTGLLNVTPAGTPEEIAEALVYSLLISPSFLMRLELDAPEEMVPNTQQPAFKLPSHEVAARLAFLIWNSAPDTILDAAADAGELQTPDQIAAQAARMVGPEFQSKVLPVVVAGHRFYANIDENSSVSRWGKKTHDEALYPEYTPTQAAALLQEMDKFFEEVGFSGQFQDLFLSNVAYVNADTAPLYGLNAADYGPELERVELDPMERPGFLTRASFLSSFASEQTTSPILRGSFILSVMGADVPAPLAGADQTPLPEGEYATNREAVTALTSVEASCIACHQQVINPPGFVMEAYSAVGTVQTEDPVYGGQIITAVDTIPFPAGAKPINNAFELMSEIAAGAASRQIYAKKWVSYATGREPNDFDQCTANTIAAKMAEGPYTLSTVLADLTQAESFRYRVAAQ